MPNLSPFPRFDQIFAKQAQRQDEETKRLHAAVAASSIPLSEELLADIVTKFDDAAQSILRNHAGYRLFRLRESYFASIDVFNVALKDLMQNISAFENEVTSEGAALLDFGQRERLKKIELQIQKELFAAANAAHSLVDHGRRLQKGVEVSGYDEMRRQEFKEDGLHELITGLRVLLHHLEVVEAGWLLRRDAGKPEIATFTLKKEEVVRTLDEFSDKFSNGQRKRMQECLKTLPEEIDLAILFSDYGERCHRFNLWLKGQISVSPPPELADYDRCRLAKLRFSTRMQWNALLGNWLHNVKNPHVHRHLPKYLNEAELAKVYALPLNSPEQADFVLSLIDTYGAADINLRKAVRTLFSRASGDGAPTSN